ncbi:hypothetical protein VE04_03085 [Pseudogymnoascus sp. 24MN13]|nr:hypothetical protein VE04_03085 [Pseudogymnoascus sp. 24MN13]
MESNGGEQDPIGKQGETASFQGEMHGNLEMAHNSGERRLIDNQGEMAAPQGETDGPDVAHGDNVQPGENYQVRVEAGNGTIGIRGPVPATTFRSRKHLALAFGFSDGEALDTWMKSEAFRPYYSGLLTNLDKISGGGSGYSRRTIRLAGVKDAIIYEEENGAKRYSRLYQVEHFTSMDWSFLWEEYDARRHAGPDMASDATGKT